MKILGLDLGTNSIGWAVVDNKENKILDAGVRIFPAGIEPDTIGQGDSEKSRNATRREKRQIRRQYFRKKLRKIKLLEMLISQGMCPLSSENLINGKIGIG
jgi:CRISPR-associated endonuclease Csn1